MDKEEPCIFCGICAHYNDGECTNEKGLLYGVRISEAMSEADHDCEVFDEVHYVLTDAGYLGLAMQEEGVEVDFKTVKRICDRFFKSLVEAGILKKGSETEGAEKWRGMTIDAGKWVYGNLEVYSEDFYIKADGKYEKVYPKSVGKFAGIKDKNGVDVYEGDVVSGFWYSDFNTGIDSECLAVVKWNVKEDRFLFDAAAVYERYICADDSKYITVAGNVFVNPEMNPYYKEEKDD